LRLSRRGFSIAISSFFPRAVTRQRPVFLP
jgi:hypothetical protein